MMFSVCSSSVYIMFIVFSLLWKLIFFVGLAYTKDIRATIIGTAFFEISWLAALYFLLKIFNTGCPII